MNSKTEPVAIRDIRGLGVLMILLVGSCGSAAVHASDSDEEREVAREIGSVLAWRLGPETVEERCRSVDPAGTESRKQALQAWLDKNADLIADVDSRVAEVVPLMFHPPKGVDAFQAVRAQVKDLFIESVFSEKSPAEVTALCKAEANPASPRWNNPGSPHVQQSLAVLYDWKTAQGAKPAPNNISK